MVIVFHPEVHARQVNNQVLQTLKSDAKNGKIMLMIESSSYNKDSHENDNIWGLESNKDADVLQTVSTLRLSQVRYEVVSQAGDHGYYVINNLVIPFW